MSRYFTRPRAQSWVVDDTLTIDAPMIPMISVSDHDPICTGLVDANGDDIWRAPLPVGFGRDGEW